jgi:chromate transporter
MLTGLGLAETTPGPLILVLVFVGYLGAFRAATGLDPFVSGLIGALIVLWMTFVPCFLWIFAGAPFIERLRGNVILASALAAITAAVVGVIANLAVWFGLQVLFERVGQGTAGPLHWPAPELASLDWRAAVVFLFAGLWLWRHGPLIPMLGLAAALGLGLRAI